MAGIQLIAEIEPKNSGSFALLDDKYLRGGLRVVETFDELSAILTDRLKDGCLAMITTPKKQLYTYNEANNEWTIFSSGSDDGGATVYDDVISEIYTWSSQKINSELENKVIKEDGKGLSTNDLTDELLEKINTPIETHTHDNKEVIDKLTESYDGKLLFNGSEIESKGVVEVDTELNVGSENPIANKTVTAKFEEIQIAIGDAIYTPSIGTVTMTEGTASATVDINEDAKIATFNFSIPKGDTGESGKDGANGVSATHSWNGTTLTVTSASGTSSANLKGDKGDTGVTPTIKAVAGSNINTVGTPSVTASTSGTTTTFTFNNLKGAKGDKGDTGSNGTTPTIKVAAGSNINTVGTPSVTASTSGTTTTFTFNNLKGATGASGTTPTIKTAAGSNINTVGTPSVSASTSGTETTFTFNYLKGAKGATGATGKSPLTHVDGSGGGEKTIVTLSPSEGVIIICNWSSGGTLHTERTDGSIYFNGATMTGSKALSAGNYYTVTNSSLSTSTRIYMKGNGGARVTVIGDID